jgi:DNA-binding transcriptional LysR family regulator
MLDWDDLRFFLAIARQGSLTAAAKDLRVAQSTVGRRLASLETNLGVRLLQRTPDGYLLTIAGERVRDQAERLEAEALAVERGVGGQDTKLEGLVRVTCTETFAAHVLAPCFVPLQAEYPGIVVELISSVHPLSLSMREADIAVRLTPSDQHDLVVRRIGRVAYGLYASVAYLGRYGVPDFEAGCSGHRIMTLMGDAGIYQQAEWLTDLTPRARLGFQTGSHEGLLSAARAGGGLACLARFRGDSFAELRRIDTPRPPPPTDIWLLVHRDSRAVPRIRAAMTAITERVQQMGEQLSPDDRSDRA